MGAIYSYSSSFIRIFWHDVITIHGVSFRSQTHKLSALCPVRHNSIIKPACHDKCPIVTAILFCPNKTGVKKKCFNLELAYPDNAYAVVIFAPRLGGDLRDNLMKRELQQWLNNYCVIGGPTHIHPNAVANYDFREDIKKWSKNLVFSLPQPCNIY